MGGSCRRAPLSRRGRSPCSASGGPAEVRKRFLAAPPGVLYLLRKVGVAHNRDIQRGAALRFASKPFRLQQSSYRVDRGGGGHWERGDARVSAANARHFVRKR